MAHTTKLDELKSAKLHDIGENPSRVKVLYNQEARDYVKKNEMKSIRARGYTDIKSYFLSPDEPIVVLVFKSRDIFVCGTIAHELEHVKQLLDGRIQSNIDKGKFECECDAYKAGRNELKKHNKLLSKLYQFDSWEGICRYFFEYKIFPIERLRDKI